MIQCCHHHTRRDFMAGMASLVGLGALAMDVPALGLRGHAAAAPEVLKVGGLPVT